MLGRQPLLAFLLWLWCSAAAAAPAAAGGAGVAVAGRGRLVRSEAAPVAGSVAVAVEPGGAVRGAASAARPGVVAEDLGEDDEALMEFLAMTHSGVGDDPQEAVTDSHGVFRCGGEGETCTCKGVGAYGTGTRRIFERVSGTVNCTGGTFTAVPAPENDCLCYGLDWCEDKKEVIDPAHRRRVTSGKVGSQWYQRRRWCGFGPRDCEWGLWGVWGQCEGTCGIGRRTRSRSQTMAAVNGGVCTESPTESENCTLPTCAPTPAPKPAKVPTPSPARVPTPSPAKEVPAPAPSPPEEEEDPTPSPTPAEALLVGITVNGVDYSQLMQNRELKDKFVSTVAETFVEQTNSQLPPGGQLSRADVSVELHDEGSVRAQATITPPPTVSAASLRTDLQDIAAPLESDLATRVKAMPGIQTVTTGAISASHMHVTLAKVGCPGILVGDKFVEFGGFRVSDFDGHYMSIAKNGFRTSVVFKDDGKAFPGPRPESDGFTTWTRSPGVAKGISIGDKFLQIGKWRLGDLDGAHFSIAHQDGMTEQIFRKDGRVFKGERHDYTTWTRPAGKAAGVHFGDKFVQIGDWRVGAHNSSYFAISHREGKASLVLRFDGKFLPGRGIRTDKDFGTWSRPTTGCRITAAAPESGGDQPAQAAKEKRSSTPASKAQLCPGIRVGDNFVEVGGFRISNVGDKHLSIAKQPFKSSLVCTSEGQSFPGPRPASQGNTTWDRKPGPPKGISMGDRYLQIGPWRLGDVDGSHFSIAHSGGFTAAIFGSQGVTYKGGRRDYTTWNRPAGPPKKVYFGDQFIELGNWRLGAADTGHFSFSHKDGKTAAILQSDGRFVPGRGRHSDFGTWSRPKIGCQILASGSLEEATEIERRSSARRRRSAAYLAPEGEEEGDDAGWR